MVGSNRSSKRPCFPSFSLLHCCLVQSLFTCLEVLSQGCLPSWSVSSDGFPAVDVDVEILQVSLHHILEAQLWASSAAVAPTKFAIEHGLRDSVILHTAHKSKPAQSALFEKDEHAGKGSSVKDFSVRDLVLPRYVQNSAKTSQMKNIEAFLMLGVCCPSFTAV